MALLGLRWRAAPADLEEEAFFVGDSAVSAVNVAVAKAAATRGDADETILAADTLVVVDGDILAKPLDAQAARAMLRRLRGRNHHVMTGVALRSQDLAWAGVVDTEVLMRDYGDDEIEAYIGRGEPFDKAGGYAVQDAAFRPVQRLIGCYLNVVGLPLCAVAAGLNALGTYAAPAGPPRCAYCRQGETLVSSG